MKRYIKTSSEPICGMATIGINENPLFRVEVNPDRKRSGDCYFKCYDGKNAQASTKVARISFTSPEYFYHTDELGNKHWRLNSKYKSELIKFLNRVHRNYKGTNITHWIHALYSWNLEFGFLNDDFGEEYSSDVEAFYHGFYDTAENLADPSYLPSTLTIPNYMELD